VKIGRHSYVAAPHDVTAQVVVGNFTSIAPYAQMHSRAQHPCVREPRLVSASSGRAIPGYPKPEAKTRIAVGHDVWIGRNVVLLGGITIGHGAIIGAYSVVAKDIPPYAVVVGNPAQIKRYRFDKDTIAGLLTVQWWDWPDAVIAERAADLRDVRVLVAKYAYGQAD
jgi:acetyltransferase-like isoleucine patch superfamily enzyme